MAWFGYIRKYVPIPITFALLTLAVATLSPCGTMEPVEPEPAAPVAGGETVATEPEPEPEPQPEPEPPPDPALAIAPRTIQSHMGPAEAAALREIADRAELSDDVFAKLGGSSAATHSFLHCFARESLTDLGTHTELAPTLELFREARARGTDPFRRESTATVVGWSLRQGLTGRPSRIVREVRDISARYALLFFGGNDVQGRNERRFGERLEDAIDQLTRRGVVPILGAVLPRGDADEMDEHATHYNEVSRGLALAHRVPYIDFHQAVSGLARQGLASDGVHPNVFQVGGRGRPCVLTEEGLAYGQNQRNLRTLESLHRVRLGLAGAPPDAPVEPLFGDRTAEVPLRLSTLPFGETWERAEEEVPAEESETEDAGHAPADETAEAADSTDDAPDPTNDAPEPTATESSTLDGYGCENAEPANGPERVYRIRTETPVSLTVHTFGGARVVLLGETMAPSACVAFAEDTLEAELQPGIHHVVVERSADEGRVTVLMHGEAIAIPTADPAADPAD